MSIYLFSNNASTTLAAPITIGSTALTVAAGTGILFPNPTTGQVFTLTLSDAATGLLNEIMLVTGVSGDTFTVVRGQEGTNAQNWAAGDIVQNLNTAGSMASLAPDQTSGAGWQRLPGGRILQWGQHVTTTTADTVTLPIPFPNTFESIVASNDGPDGHNFAASPDGLAAFFLYVSVSGEGAFWQAVGS